MSETAASSASAEMDRKRKYMDGLNRITQTQQVVNDEEVEEKMTVGGGKGETAATDSRREGKELLEEDDPLQLTLSPFPLRRPRPTAQVQVQKRPSPSPFQQLLPPTPPSFGFPHQDHHASFPSFGGYPDAVRLPVGMGALLNSVPLLAATAANAAADQSVGGGARAAGASESAITTARTAAASLRSSSSSSSSNRSSNRRNPTQTPRAGKNDKVPPPFEWATDRRAIVHNLAYLRSKGIRSISGEVQCKRCDSQCTMEYDVESKFLEMEHYIRMHKSTMHDRAPKEWMTPKLPDCQKCGQQDCVKPIISIKKRSINWLFLLLGKMLGCCTLEQLRYFCKHTKNHRTGAKDRVLYLTYLALCKQLHPDGPFDR